MVHKILFVDDDPHILASLTRALRKEPYTILCANSAEEALRILHAESVDLAVSDEAMPGMHGTELLARIREEFPDTLRFMLTGKPSLEVAVKAINEGAISRFFIKPCNHIELAMAIRDALRQKDLMAEAMRLLRTVREQSAFLETLEQCPTGISNVTRDDSGAVVVNEKDVPDDFDAFLQEIRDTCEQAEQKMGSLIASKQWE